MYCHKYNFLLFLITCIFYIMVDGLYILTLPVVIRPQVTLTWLLTRPLHGGPVIDGGSSQSSHLTTPQRGPYISSTSPDWHPNSTLLKARLSSELCDSLVGQLTINIRRILNCYSCYISSLTLAQLTWPWNMHGWLV